MIFPLRISTIKEKKKSDKEYFHYDNKIKVKEGVRPVDTYMCKV